MTVPYYGKRNPGSLTAAAPGDTLHFQFGSYNDSGDSEAQTGFAVTDIEVFKNGDPTPRATDSGYSLISDTGQMGDRAGLNRFSVQLFNTTDDTGFFDAGSWYQVAVDAVTIDGKTVRFWAGSFEIGTPDANIVRVLGDTGAARRLFRFLEKLDTGGDIAFPQSTIDTGAVNNAVWNGLRSSHATAGTFGQFVTSDVQLLDGDTGAATHLQQAAAANQRLLADVRSVLNDTGAAHLDQGRFGVISDSGRQAAVLDTGKVASAVWASHQTRTLTAFQFDTGIWGSNFASGRRLTAFQFDTGIAQTVWRSSTSSFTADTGSVAYAQGRLMAVRNDTGAAHLDGGRLGVSATATLDTGAISNAVWNSLRSSHGDTGTFGEHLSGSFGVATVDTGAVSNAVWNSLRSSHTDTGTFGEHLGGSFGVATVDTGAVSNAVWNSRRDAHTDTGTYGEHLGGQLGGGTSSVDTGLVSDAVWNSARASHVAAGSFGQYVNANVELLDADTGAATHLQQAAAASQRLQADIRSVLNDTGAAHLDQGRFGVLSDSGRQAAVLDTGKVASAVWASHQTRTLTAFGFDTVDTGEINRAVWQADASRTLTSFQFDTGIWTSPTRLLTAGTNIVLAKGTGVTGFNDPTPVEVATVVWATASRTLTAFQFDTGIWASPSRTLTAFGDTGINQRLTAIEGQTSKLTFDTGGNILSDIRKVNNIGVQGSGDTGTGDTWRPVT